MSIELEMRDIVAAIEYLHALPFVDLARIGVSGHSPGGLIGVMEASRDGRRRAVLSLAGGYRSWHQGPTNARRRVQQQADETTRLRRWRLASAPS